MALADGVHVQAILIGYAPSGQGWVGWVVLAVIVSFLAVSFLGLMRGWLRAAMIKWRSRHQVSGSPTPSGPEVDDHAP
jgi:hypothetical protein